MKKIKVLQVFGDPISYGGQERFVYNVYKNMKNENIIFDLFTPFYCNNSEIIELITKRGGKIYHYDIENEQSSKNKKAFTKTFSNFLEYNKYEIVHIHSGSIFTLSLGAKIAKKMETKNVIVHSHSSGLKNLKYRIIKSISKNIFIKNVDYYFSCSIYAAYFKYPKEIIENRNYEIINNAIDSEKFRYLEEKRKEIRKNLNAEDKIILGHVGRFSFEKNHSFLLEVFNEYRKINSNSILILIGNGDLQKNIKKKAVKLGISNDVKFLETTENVNEFLNAMDIFVLPSFYEGLPIVGVEAEANGLPVISSAKAIDELPIKELTYYYSLENSARDWALKINNILKNINRKDRSKEIIDAGYEIFDVSKYMEKFYEVLSKGENYGERCRNKCNNSKL